MVVNAAIARIVSVGVLFALVEAAPVTIAPATTQVVAAHVLPTKGADDAPPSNAGGPPKRNQGGTDW
jgi:hypothetical protein